MRYCRLTADGSFDIYADDNADKLLESVPLLDTLVTFEEGECCCHAQFTIADKLKGLSTRIGITVITCRDRNNELVREWAEAISRLDGVETVHAHDDGDGADEEEPASPPALSKLASRAQSSASVVSGSTGAYELLKESSTGEAVSTGELSSQAVLRLKRAVRRYVNRKFGSSHPYTFRNLAPEFVAQQKVRMADFGYLRFIGYASATKNPPRFLHLAATREPFMSMEQYTRQVLSLMANHWSVPDASVVISITGGAQAFQIPKRLETAFTRGLAKAALATNAWIITGGTDAGVMQLVGRGLAEYNALSKVQCIGIAPYGVILGREKMEEVRDADGGKTIDWDMDYEGVGFDGANLEPNHTHFLLPDTGAVGRDAWGGETKFRNSFEYEYCKRKKLSRVCIVVQGGPGTLDHVLITLKTGCPVILIADSGGVAELIDIFIKHYQDKLSPYYMKGHIPSNFKKFRDNPKHVMELEEIAKINWDSAKIHSFRLGEGTTAELDVQLLNAVINDRDQCPPGGRLRLAVEWQRIDVVNKVMHEQQVKPIYIRDALQTAIVNKSAMIVKLLISQHPKLVASLNFIDLYKTGERFSALFANNARLQDELLKDDIKDRSSLLATTGARRYARAITSFLGLFVPNIHERLRLMVLSEEEEKRKAKTGRNLLSSRSARSSKDPTPLPSREPSARSSVELNQAPRRIVVGITEPAKTEPRVLQSSSKGSDKSSGAGTERSLSRLSVFGAESKKPPVPSSPGIDDCILWAVLVRENTLVEAMWQTLVSNGDPIRMAMIASASAKNAAKRDLINQSTYEEHAKIYLNWACEILDRCKDKQAANYVLRRPSQHGWPHTILRVAMDTGAKDVVGHRHVQALVDASWRGQGVGYQWALPDDCSSLSLVMHYFWPSIEMVRNSSGLPVPKGGWRGIAYVPRVLYNHYTNAAFRGFLHVPQVKFFSKVIMNVLFLTLYFLKIAQHGQAGALPHTSVDLLDVIFYVWVVAMWFDEAYQWVGEALRGENHFESLFNMVDVALWGSLLIAAMLRVFIIPVVCDEGPVPDPYLDGHGGHGHGAHVAHLVESQINELRNNPAHIGRMLRHGGVGDPMSSEDDTSGNLASAEIHFQLYHGCSPMVVERLILAFGFIATCCRFLQYMVVKRELGVIAIIIGEIMKTDLIVFSTLALVFVVSFGGALVALMPLHGSAPFHADGAFYIPWWAMFGEFGEVMELGISGGYAGSMLTWAYTFIVQIVLVNLLIAMMTDTYQKIQANADNEWKFTRVSIVDEFATAFYLPPPMSLPWTAYYTMVGVHKIFFEDTLMHDLSSDNGEGNDKSDSMLPRRHQMLDARLLDAVEQSVVIGMTNPSPELIWMQTYLEDVEKNQKQTILQQLHELGSDRDRAHSKMYEIQDILFHLKDQVAGINDTISKFASDSGRRDSRADSMSRLSPVMMANYPATGKDSPVVGPVDDGVRERLEAQLLETKTKLDETKLAYESEVGTLKREAASSTKSQRALITQLRTQLKRYQFLERLHIKARGPHAMYPSRFTVPDEYVDWRLPYAEYVPTAYTASVVIDNDSTVKQGGWADPANPTVIALETWNTGPRASYEGDYVFDKFNRPLNPRGRTGMCERGLLGKWGPNHAADPIITRYDPDRPYQMQMVAILRRDIHQWAIPGGMVDMGECVSVTVKREFTEEAGAIEDPEKKELFTKLTNDLFNNGELVSRGYVDDPRNTDNAWMESAVFHFHCTAELGKLLPLHAGDDAAAVMWLDIDPSNAKFANLYASHRDFVMAAVEQMTEFDEQSETGHDETVQSQTSFQL